MYLKEKQMKSLIFAFRNTYGHQTWQSNNLQLGNPTFSYVALWIMWSREKLRSICISTTSMAAKLGRAEAYGGGHHPQVL